MLTNYLTVPTMCIKFGQIYKYICVQDRIRVGLNDFLKQKIANTNFI